MWFQCFTAEQIKEEKHRSSSPFWCVAGGCLGKWCSLPRSVHRAGHPVETLRASEAPICLALKGYQMQKCRSTTTPARLFLMEIHLFSGARCWSLPILMTSACWPRHMHLSSFNLGHVFMFFLFLPKQREWKCFGWLPRKYCGSGVIKGLWVSGFYILPYYITIFDCNPA